MHEKNPYFFCSWLSLSDQSQFRGHFQVAILQCHQAKSLRGFQEVWRVIAWACLFFYPTCILYLFNKRYIIHRPSQLCWFCLKVFISLFHTFHRHTREIYMRSRMDSRFVHGDAGPRCEPFLFAFLPGLPAPWYLQLLPLLAFKHHIPFSSTTTIGCQICW